MRSGSSSSSGSRSAEPTWPRVASTSGPPTRARLSRVERPTARTARLFPVSPPMALDVQTGDGLDGGAARGIEVTRVDQVVGQRSALVARPGGEGREQRPLVDQAVLQGEQTEEEIAIGIDGGHGMGLPNALERGPRGAGLRRRCPPPRPRTGW